MPSEHVEKKLNHSFLVNIQTLVVLNGTFPVVCTLRRSPGLFGPWLLEESTRIHRFARSGCDHGMPVGGRHRLKSESHQYRNQPQGTKTGTHPPQRNTDLNKNQRHLPPKKHGCGYKLRTTEAWIDATLTRVGSGYRSNWMRNITCSQTEGSILDIITKSEIQTILCQFVFSEAIFRPQTWYNRMTPLRVTLPKLRVFVT